MTPGKKNKRQNLEIVLLIGLVAVAAGLRVYGMGWGLPEVYEEATPFKRAWLMWGFGPNKDFSLNPDFFNYPSLTIYIQMIVQALTFAGMKIGGVVDTVVDIQVRYVLDKTPFYLAARTVSALFGAATVGATYALCRHMMGRALAAAAALLIAINVFHITKSQSIEVDVPLAFFVVLSLWMCIRLVETPSLRNHVMAGLAIGLAVSTKYTGALLALPLLLSHILARRGSRRAVTTRGLWIGLGAAAAIFALTSPFVFLDYSTFWQHFSGERRHMVVGHFGADSSATWLYYVRSLTTDLLGWPLAVLGFAGMVFATAIRRRTWAIVLAAFAVPYLLAVGSWAMRAPRYVLPVVPLWSVYAMAMVDEALRLRVFRRTALWRVAAGVVAVVVCAGPLLAEFPEHLARIRPDTRTMAREWVDNNIPGGSLVAIEAYGPSLFGSLEFWKLEPAVRERISQAEKRPRFYGIQPIPMLQTTPELTEPFYDLAVYRDFDAVITSSAVKSRYLKAPDRFAKQIRFYEDLERDFERLIEFAPSNGPGPTITVYKNPSHTLPFGRRKNPPQPVELTPSPKGVSGEESFFYLNLGLNYETYNLLGHAVTCYMLGIQRPRYRPEVYSDLALGAFRCLGRLGKTSEADRFIEEAIANAPTPSVRDYIRRMRAYTVGN